MRFAGRNCWRFVVRVFNSHLCLETRFSVGIEGGIFGKTGPNSDELTESAKGLMADRFEVAGIGAGAAGLAAAKKLTAQGIRFVLLEASHRIGGRAHTEYPPDGAPFDLGCPWMHSASINPFVPIADEYLGLF
ncbi:MAG: hypothetical protein CM1200mP18_22290 [Gammaproteobacteria bacterium]|nr:MAG: hypothetical protein CM1200mP18_22290 [Gammaproteobacteria bacterium]